jgi:uncharacterized protein (TIGR02588 family)
MSNVKKNWLEWAVFGVGLVLILLLMAYLIYDAVTIGDDPPVIDVQLGTTESRNGSFLVPVTLHNLGEETAENVTIEVLLLAGGEEVESAEIAFDFVPRDSTRSGWVTFMTDPRSVDEMQPRVLGYQIP